MKRIAVIGGGAAGLVAGIAAASAWREAGLGPEGLDVAVYEMDPRVGRRILVTGNGRCNFSNANVGAEAYRNADFVSRVFAACPPAKVWDYFSDLGLLWETEPDGRMLPRTGKASTVVDVLRARMRVLGVRECCDSRVERLVPPASKGGAWTLVMADGRFERAEAVVVTTGGQDACGFLPEDVARTAFSPVLGPCKTDTSLIKGLDGIRVPCRVALVRHEQPRIAEEGELLFRKYGVSGICVFNLSRFIDDDSLLMMNFLPEMAHAKVQALLAERAAKALALDSSATVVDILRGIVLPQVAEALCAFASTKSSRPLADCTDDDFDTLAAALVGFPLEIHGIAEPGQCQVHRGGVDVDAVTEALECRAHPGLFFAGEVLDVDGPCGGYNLHWAWTSGLVAGTAAAILSQESTKTLMKG